MKASALGRRLTPEQRHRLVTDAKALIEQYRGEMEAGYYPERREAELFSNDDFSSRRTSDPQQPRTIFDLSNESPNIVRNVTRFMKARCSEDIFGSKPFVGITAVGAMDAPLAEQIGRHGPWKLDQAQWAKVGKEGIGLALDLGECIVKTTHRTDLDQFDRLEVVLVDRKTKKPLMAPQFDEAGNPRLNAAGEHEGDYIYPEDATVPSTALYTRDERGQLQPAGEGPERLVFEKCPDIAFDESVTFLEVLIEEKEVRYHGLDVANVRFDALIAPLNVPSLDVAPLVAHEYGRTVSQLRALYYADDEETKWLFEQLAVEPDGPKTAEEQPRATYGEVSAGTQLLQNNPNVKVTEVFMRNYDVFEDGTGRNVFLVLAADLDEPLYVEYLANITIKGRLCLHPVPVNRVPGRWYGRGFYKLYKNSQRLIDALVNAILWRNENNADPLVAYQPDATEEGRSEKRLVRTPGKCITLRAGKTAADAVGIIEFPDLDDRTWELVQLIMQLVQTDSGVTSAAQGDYSALPSASTATGISSILQSASTLHRMLTEDLKDGFEPAILFGLLTAYAKQDKDETFQLLEGKAAEVMSLANARVLAKLELNVKLLLTRFQLREQRESAQLVIKDVLPQWVQILQASGLPTLHLAQSTQPLFLQVAKGSDIQQAETIFAIPPPLPPAPPPEDPNATPPDAPTGGPTEPAAPVNVVPDAAPAEAAPA